MTTNEVPVCSRCGGPRDEGMAWLKDALCEDCEEEDERTRYELPERYDVGERRGTGNMLDAPGPSTPSTSAALGSGAQ